MNLVELVQKRKDAIQACLVKYNLEPNPDIDNTVLTFENFPDTPSKKLALLIAAYKREAAPEILSKISTQSAGLVRDLREDGFVVHSGSSDTRDGFYKNANGEICRMITGFHRRPARISESVQRLLEKSIAACVSSIEVYNKPDFKYREETFSILICNAWELLLKARCAKDGGLRSIYKRDKGKIKLNRCNNPMTLAIYEAASVLINAGILNQKCWDNVELLIEIRDNAIHFVNKGKDLSIKVYEVGTAALQNYVVAVGEWFQKDLSTFNFYLMPLSFFHQSDVESNSVHTQDRQTRNLINYLKRVEAQAQSEDANPYSVTLQVKTKFVKTYSSDFRLEARWTKDGEAPEMTLTQEDAYKNTYKLTYDDLVAKLKGKYPSFRTDAKFHRIKKGILQSDTDYKLHYLNYLDPINKRGTPKILYNPEIIKEFHKYYAQT